MSEFTFDAAPIVPFRDKEVIARLRRMTREELVRHPNPEYRISIIPDREIEFRWLTDLFWRIWKAREEGRRIVLITPQPYPNYKLLAELLNRFRVDCHHLYTFNMDEYADQDGRIAPETWPQAFHYSMLTHFYAKLDEDLRPPVEQIRGLNNENIGHYGELMEELGGPDACYSGPGWTGHLAFIEPDAPEFAAASLEEWKKMGPRVATLSPFTLAQNSLHGAFGSSGDLTAVPPKAATIGPAQVLASKYRLDLHSITVNGSFASWQRMVTRLATHGPVTPLVPESILQTVPTDVWISESSAAPIEVREDLGY